MIIFKNDYFKHWINRRMSNIWPAGWIRPSNNIYLPGKVILKTLKKKNLKITSGKIRKECEHNVSVANRIINKYKILN